MGGKKITRNGLSHILDFHLSTTVLMEEKWRAWYFFLAKSILWKIFLRNKTGLGHLNKTKVTGPVRVREKLLPQHPSAHGIRRLAHMGTRHQDTATWYKTFKVARKQPQKNYLLAIFEGQNTTNKSNLKSLIVKITDFNVENQKWVNY